MCRQIHFTRHFSHAVCTIHFMRITLHGSSVCMRASFHLYAIHDERLIIRSLSVSSCLSVSCFSPSFTSSIPHSTSSLTSTPSSMSTAPRETTAAPSPIEEYYTLEIYHPPTLVVVVVVVVVLLCCCVIVLCVVVSHQPNMRVTRARTNIYIYMYMCVFVHIASICRRDNAFTFVQMNATINLSVQQDQCTDTCIRTCVSIFFENIKLFKFMMLNLKSHSLSCP